MSSPKGALLKRMVKHINRQTVPEEKRIKKWKILKGDTVQVISGKDKGKIGKVLRVIRKQNRLIVEGVQLVKKHVKGTSDMKGGIFTRESPLAYNRVQLVDPTTGKGASVVFRFLEDGTRVRAVKDTNTVIAKPKLSYLTRPKNRVDSPKDTAADLVLKKTFSYEELD